jgi:uncharacterized protein
VTGPALLLLRTAAYYHDIGFIERADGHEAAGVRIARAALPAFGYGEPELLAIGGMIMATRLPQRPNTPLERLLADADLDVLGREDFRQRNRLLRAELAALGGPVDNAQWLRDQLGFLEGHSYWTASARRLRDERKRRHIAELRATIAVSS